MPGGSWTVKKLNIVIIQQLAPGGRAVFVSWHGGCIVFGTAGVFRLSFEGDTVRKFINAVKYHVSVAADMVPLFILLAVLFAGFCIINH